MSENLSAEHQQPINRTLEILIHDQKIKFNSKQDVFIKAEPQSDHILDTPTDDGYGSTLELISKDAVYNSPYTESDRENTEKMSTDQVYFDGDIKPDIKLEVFELEPDCELLTCKTETSFSCCHDDKEENFNSYQTMSQPTYIHEDNEKKVFCGKEEAEYNINESSVHMDDVKPLLKQEVGSGSDEHFHNRLSVSLQCSLKDQHIKLENQQCNSKSNYECTCNSSIQNRHDYCEEINNDNVSVAVKKELRDTIEQEEQLISSYSKDRTNIRNNCYQGDDKEIATMLYSSHQSLNSEKPDANANTTQCLSIIRDNKVTKVKEHQSKKYNCTICAKCFSKNSDLNRHTMIHTGSRPYQCTKCSKRFTRKSHLTDHERIHTGLKPYQCSHCSKSFTRMSQLTVHERIHTGLRPYQCSQCSQCFNRKSYLTYHEGTHTDLKPFQCSHCSESFTRKSDLTRHENIHTGLKPYQCSHCSKSFTQMSQLTVHERTHTGLKPYQCSQCSKRFYRPIDLLYHEMTHTGLQPYQCSHCSKSFNRKSNLTVHERIHTGLKPYQCSHCSKSFTTKSQLTDHEKIHTGLQPFPCLQCSKRFNRKSRLTNHEKIHTAKQQYQ